MNPACLGFHFFLFLFWGIYYRIIDLSINIIWIHPMNINIIYMGFYSVCLWQALRYCHYHQYITYSVVGTPSLTIVMGSRHHTSSLKQSQRLVSKSRQMHAWILLGLTHLKEVANKKMLYSFVIVCTYISHITSTIILYWFYMLALCSFFQSQCYVFLLF